MELKKEERCRNVADAFAYAGIAPMQGDPNAGRQPPDPPKKVLLLDDVATTLSTLNSCAKALKAAGVKTVSAIVLARVN